MPRAVTADHILFDECIDAFRREFEPSFDPWAGPSFSYLLTSFALEQPWQLPNCKVHPSFHILLPGVNSAFISKVDNPEWGNASKPQFFGIALSAIVTFVTGSPCKSTRDAYLCENPTLTQDTAEQLAVMHPIRTGGPGALTGSISKATQQRINDELTELITKLHKLPYKKYLTIMQAIRLVHLSQLTKKDDFGLAYFLIISAIEAVAQEAYKNKKFGIKNPQEAIWTERAKNDEDFSQLLHAFKEARSKDKHIKEKYIKFIASYSPVSEWEKIIPHPDQESINNLKESSLAGVFETNTSKGWYEKYPSELKDEEITKIISDSYKHRSCFVHRGEQPPHQSPTCSNRFFQEHRQHIEGSTVETLLPNYELLTGIARHSIRSWMNTLI